MMKALSLSAILIALFFFSSGCASIQPKVPENTPDQIAENYWRSLFDLDVKNTYYMFSSQVHKEIPEDVYYATTAIALISLHINIMKLTNTGADGTDLSDQSKDLLAHCLSFIRFKTDNVHEEKDEAQVIMHVAYPALEAFINPEEVDKLHKFKIKMSLLKEPGGWKLNDLHEVAGVFNLFQVNYDINDFKSAFGKEKQRLQQTDFSN